MISEFFMSIVFNLVEGALSILPNWNFNIDTAFLTTAFDLIRTAFYLLPMGTIVTMISIIWFFHLFRITISVLKTIWEVLPLV